MTRGKPMDSHPDSAAAAPRQTDSGTVRLLQCLSESRSSRVFAAETAGLSVIVKLPASASAAGHEAKLLRRLDGAAAPRLLAMDALEGRPALVLERLAGSSLLDLARADAGFAGTARFCRILQGFATSLATLHGRGVFHGDLKPDHVIVGPDDRVRLIDLSAAADNDRQPPSDENMTWLTPGFAAPEQLTADPRVGASTDIFSFGAVALWSATGRALPDANGVDAEAVAAALHDSPLAGDLQAVVMACLRDDPAERPANAAALAELIAASSPAPAAGHDPVPPTVQVRKRRPAARKRGGGGEMGAPRRGGTAALIPWLLLLLLAAGLAGLALWQGPPLYERHFKTTWLISADGAGDAASLADAAARAGHAVTFLLAPGDHPGGLLRGGDYHIRPADAAADPPVIRAGGEGCLAAFNARIDIAGLVFRGDGGTGGIACIRLSGGTFKLRDSVIEQVPGTAIAAGDGARLDVAASELLSVGGDAIQLEAGATLELADSRIAEAAGNAVAASGGARMTLRNNDISQTAGLLVASGARAHLEGDAVRGSAASALEAAAGADVALSRVTLAESTGAGIFLHGGSRLRVAESRILDNGLSGLYSEGAARIEVHDSLIAGNGEHGVLSLGDRAGRLSGNEIARNGGYGLVLDPASRLDVGDNRLETNAEGPLLDARRDMNATTETGTR